MATITWTFGTYSFKTNANLVSYEENIELRLDPKQIPGRHGALTASAPSLSAKLIGPLSFYLLATSPDDLEAKLDTAKAALAEGSIQQLSKFDDRYINAQTQSFGHDYGPQMLSALCWVTFLCPDPFWVSETLDTLPVAPTTWTTDTSSAIVNNGGNAPTPVIITLTVPAATT